MSDPDVVVHTSARQSFSTGAQVAGVAYPSLEAAAAAQQQGAITVDIHHVRAQTTQRENVDTRDSNKKDKSKKVQQAGGVQQRNGDQKKKSKHSIDRPSPSDSFTGKYAVDVRGVTHSYDKKKNVLSKLDLQIKPGQIYGLLGPSGCGKTTLIKCLLAQLTPKEGEITVFGEVPGSALSQVPGHDVGYMPQEIALYDEFTIMQNLHFYAKTHNMSEEDFKRRSKYLCRLLDLKDPYTKNAGQLSGGQQRRASLACGLLHCPKLLILDEPTVGVDPTLRTKIWRYLTRISREEGTTVLLTTHYIEEARRANRVGLMRDGKMLQQGTPKEVMKQTNSKTLESAFLKICKKDEKKLASDKDDDNKDSCWSCCNPATHSTEADSDLTDEENNGDNSDDDLDSDDDAEEAEGEAEADAINEGAGGSGESASPESSPKQRRSGKSQAISSKKSSFSELSNDDFKQPLLGAAAAAIPSSSSRSKKGGGGKGVQAASSPNQLQSPTAGYEPEVSDEEDGAKSGDSKHKYKDGKTPELVGWDAISTSLALPRWPQLWGLCWKNLMRMVKGVGAMIFQFILPSIQVILFCVAIGKDPQHIKFGVVNQDNFSGPLPVNITALLTNYPTTGMPHALGGSGAAGAGLFVPDWNAASQGLMQLYSGSHAVNDGQQPASNFLSQDFLSEMDKHFILRNYGSEEQALKQVEKNTIWGFVSIPTNFTINTLERIAATMISPLIPVANDTRLNSTLRYTLDMSNEQMTIFLVKSISSAYSNLIGKYAPSLAEESPLQMDPPVYGDADASFTDFVAPGIIITIAFSGSIGLTAITFVLDKKTGNLDRIWASGLRASEIMLAQVLTQLIVFVIQIGLLLVFGLLVFHLPLKGSVVLLFIICILLGITGMMFGLVIASKVNEERDAMQCALGSFFPALLLSGVMWPVESIPVPLYQVAMGLPTTWAAEAGRSIMSRGWGIEHQQVWLGIVVPAAWSFVFFLWAAKSLRPKQ